MTHFWLTITHCWILLQVVHIDITRLEAVKLDTFYLSQHMLCYSTWIFKATDLCDLFILEEKHKERPRRTTPNSSLDWGNWSASQLDQFTTGQNPSLLYVGERSGSYSQCGRFGEVNCFCWLYYYSPRSSKPWASHSLFWMCYVCPHFQYRSC